MNQATTALPISRYHSGTNQQQPTVASLVGAPAGNQVDFAEVVKTLTGGKPHHHGASGATHSLFDSNNSNGSADAFGVSNSGSSPSVDAFGAASATPSSTADAINSISDPFSSLASNFSIQAQLNSQKLLDL